MNAKRLFQTIRLMMIGGAENRAEYFRKNEIFAKMGTNCSLMQRTVPLYPKLISIGNNVHTASNVNFVPHDVTHEVFNNILLSQGRTERLSEKLGCIEIGDNVFIGAGVRILYDVKIGNNVIIGANALVTKDVPSNSVVAGLPARVIGTFEQFMDKRMNEKQYPKELAPVGQEICISLQEWLWEDFHKRHKN